MAERYRPKPCADCPGRQSLMCCRRKVDRPPGLQSVTMTIERIRKVRLKLWYRAHYLLADGTRQTGIMRP